jgi:hypothetical protein
LVRFSTRCSDLRGHSLRYGHHAHAKARVDTTYPFPCPALGSARHEVNTCHLDVSLVPHRARVKAQESNWPQWRSRKVKKLEHLAVGQFRKFASAPHPFEFSDRMLILLPAR